MWNAITELRSLSSILQWSAIALVFFGGFLQIGTFIVDRRVKTLEQAEQAEKLNPVAQVIRTATAIVELVQDAKDPLNTHFMDSGAVIAFGKGTQALMVLRSLDSFANQNGRGEIIWRATLTLDLADPSVGRPIRSLKETEYVQVAFGQLKEGATIKSGSVTVTINSAVQLRAELPTQIVTQQQLAFARQLDDIKKELE
jgi:hypothetical protein